ncbi:MAG: hypothetical protein GZ088_09400 [Acidipila sp.]|nr:hypothetical protein [Acidipila sp.]
MSYPPTEQELREREEKAMAEWRASFRPCRLITVRREAIKKRNFDARMLVPRNGVICTSQWGESIMDRDSGREL